MVYERDKWLLPCYPLIPFVCMLLGLGGTTGCFVIFGLMQSLMIRAIFGLAGCFMLHLAGYFALFIFSGGFDL